jgi:hypothetical protein
MNVEHYPYYANPSFFDFEFASEGRMGRISKIARFTSVGHNIYNFGFGDLDEDTGNIRDDVVSNNGDAEKVLFTVAQLFTILQRYIQKHRFLSWDRPLYVRAGTRYISIVFGWNWNQCLNFLDTEPGGGSVFVKA